jgi:hypothetical protein
MFERTGKHKKKQKNIFFNYFLIYLVAIIVIITLYTKNIILIIRCRINRNCFDIYSEIKHGSEKLIYLQKYATK